MSDPHEVDREAWRVAATNYLAAKWTQPRNCPICASDQWTISTFGEVRYLQVDSLLLGGPVFPVFFATCVVCGYMHMFNVRVAGIGPESHEDRAARGEPGQIDRSVDAPVPDAPLSEPPQDAP